jgi:hypothetical protein
LKRFPRWNCVRLLVTFGLSAAAGFSLVSSVAFANEGRFYSYTTALGDSLLSIASKHLIDRRDWQSLQKLNAIKNPNAIPVGSRIKIPVDAMRMEPASVKVVSVQGSADASGKPIKVGEVFNEGSKLATGADGFVTLQLADGSVLTVQSKSSVRLENTRQFVNSGGVTDSIIRLDAGRVETTVAKQRNSGARYEIRTPTSNMGVRGTVFRVATEGGDTNSNARASSEVLEGRVAVSAVSTGAGTVKSADVALNQGFGTVAEANKAPLPPIELLPAPVTSGLAKRMNDSDIEFKFSADSDANAKAKKYRGQLARDKAFKNPVADVLVDIEAGTAKIRFATVAVGEYFLRVRAIDGLGLEGNNGEHTFNVVRQLAAPTTNASLADNQFVWSAVPGAALYRLQVSTDEKFATLLIDEAALKTPSFTPGKPLGFGNYFWRVAALDQGGVAGIFSAPQNLIVVGAPVPLEPPRVDGARVTFAWIGNAALLYQLQIARDEWFHDIVVTKQVTGNLLTVDDMSKGFYFARIRAIRRSNENQAVEALTPWSATRNIDVYASPLNLTPRK